MEPPPKTSPDSFSKTLLLVTASSCASLGPSCKPPGVLIAGVSDTAMLLIVLLVNKHKEGVITGCGDHPPVLGRNDADFT